MSENIGFELDFELPGRDLKLGADMLDRIDHRLVSIDRHLAGMRADKLGGFNAGVRSATGSITEMNAAVEILGKGLTMAKSEFDGVRVAGRYALDAFNERSSFIRGTTQLFGGDRGLAELQFTRAQDFAQRTDFESSDIEKAMRKLAAQGLSPLEGGGLNELTLAGSDLAAITGGSAEERKETLGRVTTAFGQIQAKGKLQGEELTGQLAEAGLSVGRVYEELRKAYGLKNIGEVQKKISAGEVGASVALPAITRAIMAQLGESRLGEYATKASGSVSGLESNRDEAIKNILKSFDAEEALPSMDAYKASLRDQAALFDINTEKGKRASLAVQSLSDNFLKLQTVSTEFETGFMSSFIEELTEGAQNAGHLKKFAEAAKELGVSAGRLSGGLLKGVSDGFDKFADSLGGVLNTLDRKTGWVSDMQEMVHRTLHPGTVKEGRPRDAISDDLQALKDAFPQQFNGAARVRGADFTVNTMPFARDAAQQRTKAAEASKDATTARKGRASPFAVNWDYGPNTSPFLLGFGSGKSATTASSISDAISTGISTNVKESMTNLKLNVERIEIVIDGAHDPKEVGRQVVNALTNIAGRINRSVQ